MKTTRSLQVVTFAALVIASTVMLLPADKPAQADTTAASAPIPTVTIVGKHMSPAEKLAAAADDDMPRVTIVAKRLTPSQKLASLIAEKIELAQAHLLSNDA